MVRVCSGLFLNFMIFFRCYSTSYSWSGAIDPNWVSRDDVHIRHIISADWITNMIWSYFLFANSLSWGINWIISISYRFWYDLFLSICSIAFTFRDSLFFSPFFCRFFFFRFFLLLASQSHIVSWLLFGKYLVFLTCTADIWVHFAHTTRIHTISTEIFDAVFEIVSVFNFHPTFHTIPI